LDSRRFDALARTLSAARSRRRLVATAISGALGTLGLAQVEAARTGNCKPTCGECEQCKKGACKKKNGKKRCQKGRCEPKANDSPCSGNGKCLAGTCNLPPVCIQASGDCSVADPGACCSDVCAELGVRDFCLAGASGKDCLASTDCSSGTCIGFRCQ
jgi:hypothetical protein